MTGSFKVGTQLQRGHFERRDSNHAPGTTTSFHSTGAAARDDFVAAGGLGRPAELQPRDLRAGFVDDETPDPERGRSSRLPGESVDAYHYGPGPWMPNRNVNYPEIKNVPNWKDVNPRINGSLLGNGKTAIKGA